MKTTISLTVECTHVPETEYSPATVSVVIGNALVGHWKPVGGLDLDWPLPRVLEFHQGILGQLARQVWDEANGGKS